MLHPIRSFKAIHKIRELRRQLKREQIDMKQKKQNYKISLKTFRQQRNEIREQAKNVKQTKDFVAQVKQAQMLGVNLPNNVIVECQRIQASYPTQKYAIGPNGNKQLIDSVNKKSLSDLKKIVAEKKMRIAIEKTKDLARNSIEAAQNIAENTINSKTKVQDAYEH